MAWTKIPKEHHELFYRVVPSDPRISTIPMFGGVCATVHGNMFAGLWADSMLVRLAPGQREKALALDGATEFDPMGRGRPSPDMVVLPPEVMTRPRELQHWLDRSLEYTATLPPKSKAKTAGKSGEPKSKKSRSTRKSSATKSTAREATTKRPAKKRARSRG